MAANNTTSVDRMPQAFQGLLPLIIGPLIGAIISTVTTSSGLTGKTKNLEYQIKRVELIDKLLGTIGEDDDRLRTALKCELAEIVGNVRETSIQQDELINLTYSQRIWYKRILPPFLNTLEGRLANFVFYLYGFSALFYVAMSPFLLRGRPGLRLSWESVGAVIVGVTMSFAIALLARVWAISAARRYALLRRARRLLILYSKTRGEDPRYRA